MVRIEQRRVFPILLALSIFLIFASCATPPRPAEPVSLTDLVLSGDIQAIEKFYANRKQLNLADNEGLYPLHRAVNRGDVEIVGILIELGARVDEADRAGKTPLRYAIDQNKTAVVKKLVDRGADPFKADASGSTPAEAGLSRGTAMLEAIFNPKNMDQFGADGRTALHIAADKLLVQEAILIADMGASVQIRDKANRTALELALLQKKSRKAATISEKLIQKGANPSISFNDFSWFATMVRSQDYTTVRFSNGNTPLHEAVSREQFGFADFLLSKGLSANIKNTGGDAPLHIAVSKGLLDEAELLLKNNADKDLRDGRGNTPLHLPVPANKRLAMTKLLLNFKADTSLKDQDGNTALHKAVKLAYEPLVVEELLKAGTDVNLANLEGDTPLMICVKTGNYQYAEPLLLAGASVFSLNQAGQTPLSIAVGRGVEAVNKIVLESNVLQQDGFNNSIVSTAVAMKGSPEVISLILSKGGNPNTRNNALDNALHIAVRLNLAVQGTILIAAKTDIFAENATKDTPVFLALSAKDGPYDWFFVPSVITSRNINGDTVGHLAARRDLADGLEYLRSKGTDLNAINFARETLLHSAVRTDAAEATRYLIANGAALAARDSNGDAPLHIAVISEAAKCLPILVLSGVDLNARNFRGEAAIHKAVRSQNKNFVTYLVDRGALLDVRDNSGLTPLAVSARETQPDIAQYLIKAGSAIDARDYSGSTPLYHAVDTVQFELVKAFVQAGADILAKNASGDSPLTAALKKGPTIMRDILGSARMDVADSEGKTPLRLLVDMRSAPDMIKLALERKADPSSRDKFADTPLHAALMLKDYSIATLLLAEKADPFAPNHQGLTPTALALRDPSALKDFVQAAGLNRKDILDETFLHYAVRAGEMEAIKTLFSMGIDWKLRNVSGETAADVASARSDPSIIALFPQR
jgi:hypothetical protein